MPPQEKFETNVPECVADDKESCPNLVGSSCSTIGETTESPQPCQSSNSRVPIDGDNDDENAKDVDFDDLLPHVGEFGLYQKILFILMIPFAFFVAWVYFSQIFITIIPEEHWCKVPELANLTVEQRYKKIKNC